jgi:hypothetical protein
MTHRIIIPELEELPKPAYDFWNQRDKLAVASYYGVKESQRLADYLGRSLASLQTQAVALGVSFTTSEEEREEICRAIEAGEK